jgi:hypothetical protein
VNVNQVKFFTHKQVAQCLTRFHISKRVSRANERDGFDPHTFLPNQWHEITIGAHAHDVMPGIPLGANQRAQKMVEGEIHRAELAYFQGKSLFGCA